MSIWLHLEDTDVAFSEGVNWLNLRDDEPFFLYDSGSEDTLELCNELGWGLIAPATLSKWEED